MKTLNKLIWLICSLLVISSCSRDYDLPPLDEPHYTGSEANYTIAKFKESYGKVTEPTLIDTDFILKATVVANDKSGNIFKQLYIQDETGGLYIGVDQNSVYSQFRIGQTVYVNLHGLYAVVYGDQLQIAYNKTQANRIPWNIFEEHVSLDKWADPANAKPRVVKLDALKDEMINTLVQIDNVYFLNGGKQPFVKEGENFGEQLIKDATGKTLTVRTSSYANFSKEILPEGAGTIVGILSKHFDNWQFILRDHDDIVDFGNPLPTEPEQPGENTVYFKETFGTENVADRPFIKDYKGFDMKAPVAYSDKANSVSIRYMSKVAEYGPHAWLPANKDGYLTISGIDLSKGKNLVFSFELAANLFDDGATANLNMIQVSCNGKALAMPDKSLSKANGDDTKFYKIELEGLPVEKDVTIEFFSAEKANTAGFRLDNLVIQEKDDTIILTEE